MPRPEPRTREPIAKDTRHVISRARCAGDCWGFQRAADMLRDWGLDATIHGRGKKRHFVLTIPEYWNAARRISFAAGLVELSRQIAAGHEGDYPKPGGESRSRRTRSQHR